MADQGKRKQVADHEWLDSNGDVVDEIEKATGIRYKHLASGDTFDYQLKPNSPGYAMFAAFGARTLATNEASASRQRDGATADQIGAIRERFGLIDTGTWVDRTREGTTIDKDALAEAAIQVLVAEGRLPADDDAAIANAKDKLRQKFDDDPAAVTKARKVKGVPEAYARLVGKAQASVDDLGALLG